MYPSLGADGLGAQARGTRSSACVSRRNYTRTSRPKVWACYYWIVDADARVIEIYRLTAGAYELLARPAGAIMIAAEPFPGLALTDIWP